MNAKKCGWLFLTTLVVELVCMFIMTYFAKDISIGIIESLLLSQLMVFVPTVLFLIASRQRLSGFIAWKTPKISTSLCVVLLTYLCMPLVITVNAISMLFVENEVTALQQYLIQVPAWQVLLLVGIVAPVSEEFVFRGVFYHGFRKSGSFWGAMLLSAFLFGLTHMNFNQMSYAIVIGIISVFLLEGTGSIFYSMLIHICINMTNAIQMLSINPETLKDMQQSQRLLEDTMHMPYKQMLCLSISIMAVVATITTTLAGCLFWAIVKKENRTEHIKEILAGEAKEKRQKLMSVPLVLGIVLCLGYMILDVCLMR